MFRRAMLAAMTSLPGLGRADELSGSGWTPGTYSSMQPARFSRVGEHGVRIEADANGSFIWRAVQGVPACLTWRWRVDSGPPGTDLTRRGGDDRAISLAVGFAGFPADVSAWSRAQYAIAQGVAGDRPLPRSVLIYSWGGTGDEPARFLSPWLRGLGMVHPRRPASSQTGRWFEERVDLAADWRTAFGGDPPELQEIAIGTDVDDTRTRVDAQVDRIRLTAC